MKNICGYTKQDLINVRKFIHEINDEIVVRISTDKDWQCSLPNYRLYLGAKKQPQWLTNVRLEWYKKQDFYIDNVNMSIISLLHEIGHFETFDVDEWLERNDLTYQYQQEYCDDDTMTMEQLNLKYFEIPNEYKATKWAFEYYKNNRQKCDKLAAMLGFTM